MPRLTIYLSDLAHCSSVPDTALPVPLSIGYVAAYARKYFGSDADIRLFKHPEKLMAAVADLAPDIVGFANYGWNANLNRTIGRYLRARLPDALFIAGGPNLDSEPELRIAHLRRHDYVDFVVVDGGEEPFAELAAWWRDGEHDRTKLPHNLIYLDDGGELVVTRERPLTKNIEGIQSPYLSGELDEFLVAGMVPMLETNRGCPFRCTFCAWGMASKDLVRRLDLDTALAEIAYVGERSNSSNWIVCDANFGILPRDIDIAKAIRAVRDRHGTPRKCHIWLAKNVTDRNVEIAKILDDMAVPVMAVQSLESEVLSNIKRSNIKIDTYRQYQQRFHKLGRRTYSDLIVPLPGETFDTHLAALRQLFELDVDIVMSHNMRLLAGAETNSTATRARYGFRTRYRLIHGDAGEYRTPEGGSLRAFEYEESLRATDTMAEEAVFRLRKIHFLVDFCWNIEAYKPLLRVLRTHGRNPLDVMLRLLDADIVALHPRLGEFWGLFERESLAEWHDSVEAIEAYFAQEANWKRLVGLEFEKLNTMFGVVVLRDFKRVFDAAIADAVGEANLPSFEALCRYTFALFPPLDVREEELEIVMPEGFRTIDAIENPDCPTHGVERSVRLRAAAERAALLPHLDVDTARSKTLSKLLDTAGVTLRELRYFVKAA